MRAFVRYDNQGIIVPSSFVMKKNQPKVGRWLEISTTKSVSGPPTQSSQGNLRAFVRYDGQNKIVPGSVLVRGQVPENGNWVEITYDIRRPIGNERPFILEYTIVSPNTTISIPLGDTTYSGYDFIVDWGDGTDPVPLKATDGTQLNAQMTYAYTEPGVYEIKILGRFPYMNLNTGTNKARLTDIKQWGTSQWESFIDTFRGCTGLTNITSTDAPNLSKLTNMSGMFVGCTSLTNVDALTNWNTSNVTDMSLLFPLCSSLINLNGLTNWNVSNVTTMRSMFNSCSSITTLEPLTNWNVSNVNTMRQMFVNCDFTNIDPITNWNISSLTVMRQMFANCFSLIDIKALANWDVSNVTDMSGLFQGFNQTMALTDFTPITNWDVSNVTDMAIMFSECQLLTNLEPLSNWDVGNVTDMTFMFFGNSSLVNLEPLTNWNVSNVTSMRSMFLGASSLTDTNAFSNWDVSSVTTINSMFRNSGAFNTELSQWQIIKLSNASGFMTSALGWSTINYDATLIGWEATLQTEYPGGVNYPYNITIDFGGSKFTPGGAAEAAKQSLITNFGWTITDGGAATV
jgi:surface protein